MSAKSSPRRGTKEMHAFRKRFGHVAVSVQVDQDWLSAGEFPPAAQPADTQLNAVWKQGKTLTLKLSRKDGRPLEARQIKLDISLPLLNFAHVVVPDCGRHYVTMAKGLDIRQPVNRIGGSNCGHPFFSVADEAGKFLFAFGVLNFTGETETRRVRPRISSRNALLGGDDMLQLAMTWVPQEPIAKELEIELFMTMDAKTWVHALRQYTDRIKQREKIEYPRNDDAHKPLWCNWTAFCSSELNDERVLGNAKVAKELGIASIILDDGWFGPGLDDDVYKPLNIGDYEPDPRKFPDLAALVDKVHDIGVKVLLWHAPLCVADTSKAYQKMRKYLVRREGKEFVSVNGLGQLCPACPEVRQYVAEETTRLMTAYHADGLKVDLYNCLPLNMCESTEHQHDKSDLVAAVGATMKVQWEAAKAVRPDLLLELKQDYANVRFAQYGTMVRAGDTAYDVDTNCRRCFYPQAYAHAVHNDYLMTSRLLLDDSLAMMMVRVITAGVPTFGNDLTLLNKEQLAIMKAYLGFYLANLPMFKALREPQGNDMSVWQGGTRKAAWVSAIWNAHEVRLPKAARIFLMNGTGHSDMLVYPADKGRAKLTAYDATHCVVAQKSKTLGEFERLEVPSGGMLEIVYSK